MEGVTTKVEGLVSGTEEVSHHIVTELAPKLPLCLGVVERKPVVNVEYSSVLLCPDLEVVVFSNEVKVLLLKSSVFEGPFVDRVVFLRLEEVLLVLDVTSDKFKVSKNKTYTNTTHMRR